MALYRYLIAATGAAACLTGLAAPAFAEVPKAVIKGEMPGDLRSAIEKAVGESKVAVDSRLEARRRAREAAEDTIAVLRSEGYYAYDVSPDIGDGEKPDAIVTVIPGPRFHIAHPRVTWIGAPPTPDVIQLGVSAMQLKEGAPARAAGVVAAEGRVVAAVEKRGYADAAIEPREVIVDHADQTLQPEYRIEAGNLVHLDGIDLRTAGKTNPRWVAGLAPWKRGAVYDPDDVAELEQRLLDAGVFDSVTVSLAPKDQAINGERPVVVSLADRPKGTIELGADYSTSEGAGIDGRWLRYNRLGRADTTTISARFAEISSKLDGQVAFPHWRTPKQTLTVGASVFTDNTDAFDDKGVSARVDVTTRYGRNLYRSSFRTFGLSLDATRTDQKSPTASTQDLLTMILLGALSEDRSDDPLNPTRGWKADVRVEPTISVGDNTLLYVRALAQGSTYLALGEKANTVAALRVRLGTVSGVSVGDVPAARRLYAGGGGSVRGYSYQGVGPRLIDGTPQGGLSLFEASAELRQKITEKWGAAAFWDVGAVGEQETPSFSRVSTGVGVGVRYNLGFAPIRADLAFPLNRRAGDPAYQIYVSIGQSF